LPLLRRPASAKIADWRRCCRSRNSPTIQENASGGTDHGTGGPVFVPANGVLGGLHGVMPSLTDLKGR